MSSLALALIIAAGIFHAGWNLILKQVEEKYILTWWSALASVVLLAPAVLTGGLPERAAWPYLFSSAFIQAIYMVALAAAYNLSDFSLVYPIARGAAPAFIAVWAVLFLGERISPLGGAGLALIVGGLVVVGSSGLVAARRKKETTKVVTTRENRAVPRSDDFSRSSSSLKTAEAVIPKTDTTSPRKNDFGRFSGLLLALGVAVLISGYSTIDGAAVRLTPATPYTVALLGLAGAFFTPFVVWQSGWKRMFEVGRRHWWRALLIGVGSLMAYVLVLNAYSLTQVSYAGAVREISVVFGAFAGWKLLGEGLGPVRVAGAVLIFFGVILIAIA